MMLAAATLRNQMVESQIAARGVVDKAVLAAMREVPRERFVPDRLADLAYADRPLPIEADQAISQPYIVALMIEAAGVRAGDRVLEIGAGSGYAAAVLSRIARRVYAMERQPELAELARRRMAAFGYDNVAIRTGDGSAGWPESAPFDAILVAAGGPSIPQPLREQLALGGRLVMPIGTSGIQRLVRLTRQSDSKYDRDDLGDVCFVPLIGAYGWADDAGSDALVEHVPRLTATSAFKSGAKEQAKE